MESDNDDDDLRSALDERHARRSQYRKYPDRNKRPAWHAWYNLARWQKLRRHFFQIYPNMFCSMCLESGFIVEATVCDHKIPPRGDEKLFWDMDNLDGLCLDHHNSSKQQIEKSKGFIRDIGADGFPVDDNHPFNVASRKSEERESKEMAARRKSNAKR
jgi:5-methylcytosine-specific restriction enzyme A